MDSPCTVLPIVESDLLPPHFGPKSDHFFLKNQTKNDLKSDLFPQKQDIGVKNAAQVPQNSIKLSIVLLGTQTEQIALLGCP